MLIRPHYGQVGLWGLVAVLVIILTFFSGPKLISGHSDSLQQWWETSSFSSSNDTAHKGKAGAKDEHDYEVEVEDTGVKEPTTAVANTHIEVFSQSRPSGKYFDIKFEGFSTINPNILPHPHNDSTYIIVAQEFFRGEHGTSTWNIELVCEAMFGTNWTLSCLKPPIIAPIAATYSTLCVGDQFPLNFNIGPHDARVFFGPEIPYMTFGSQSINSCFGQWIEDFRLLTDWGFHRSSTDLFQFATDLQRPPPVGAMEKNWFIFWDVLGDMYAHYDIAPNRAYAKIAPDGSAGIDLAPLSAYHDNACLQKYLPPMPESGKESIHQATNSLSITLCKRNDPSCQPSPTNTYAFTIFQHKLAYSFHSVYEPYVMMFKQTAPFEIYGISRKPIWIHGRQEGSAPDAVAKYDPQMMYITSMSWKKHGQTYHGYLDDVLFLNFGIEDSKTGGIDVLAADVLQELGICDVAQPFNAPAVPLPAAPLPAAPLPGGF